MTIMWSALVSAPGPPLDRPCRDWVDRAVGSRVGWPVLQDFQHREPERMIGQPCGIGDTGDLLPGLLSPRRSSSTSIMYSYGRSLSRGVLSVCPRSFVCRQRRPCCVRGGSGELWPVWICRGGRRSVWLAVEPHDAGGADVSVTLGSACEDDHLALAAGQSEHCT